MSSCSKQTVASAKVVKQKAEDQLAEIVGRGQVALQMYRDRHAEITKQVVAIKAMIKSTERKITEKEQQLASIPAGQGEKRQMVQSMVEHYRMHKEMLLTFLNFKKCSHLQSSLIRINVNYIFDGQLYQKI